MRIYRSDKYHIENFSAVGCHFIFDQKWMLAIPRHKGNYIASAYQI